MWDCNVISSFFSEWVIWRVDLVCSNRPVDWLLLVFSSLRGGVPDSLPPPPLSTTIRESSNA